MGVTFNSDEPLFSTMTLKYGPLDVLGRTLLVTEQLCNQIGVTLTITTAAEFLRVNQANLDTWLPLLRIVDHRFNTLNPTNSLFLFGHDKNGDVVACQAVRLLDLRGSNFATELESLRLHYRDPATMAEYNEHYIVTSLAARATTGLVAFSGGAWYRQDYRGRGLVGWLPRFARAYARSMWNTRVTVTMMTEKNVGKGVFPRNGYPNIEWEIAFNNSEFGSPRCAFLWIKDDEMLADLTTFLSSISSTTESDAAMTGAKKRG